MVLLDALGTLLELAPPGPLLVRELALRGVTVAPDRAQAALRVEIAFYRAGHHRADGPAALAELRRDCAQVLQRELGAPAARARPADVEAALLAALRFVALPDAAPALAALRAGGARLVVASNWDVSLHEALAATGLASLVDAAISSAEAGAAKPDPALLHRALALVDGRAEDAWMVGDDPDTDVPAARAAGIRPVLVRREPPGDPGAPDTVPADVVRLGSLAGLPALVRYRRLGA